MKKIIRWGDFMKIPNAIQKRENIAPYFLFIIIFRLIAYLLFTSTYSFAYAAFGILFGYVLQRYKFCFTAGLRDIFLLKNFTLTRAILILVGISTISFTLITSISNKNFSMLVQPVGIQTLIGGVLFGIGMVIAGGCATGVLMRVGEGYQMQIYAFLGLIIGSLIGAHNSSLWINKQAFSNLTFNFQESLVTNNALLLQILVIIFLYFLCLYLEQGEKVFKWENIKKLIEGNKAKKRYFKGAIYLAIINILFLYVFLSPISITIGLTYFSGGLYEKIGGSLDGIILFQTGEKLLSDPMIIFVFSIILGSFISSYLHREFRYRKVRSNKYIYMGIIGGFLMGYSARIAMGCNFGGFVNAVASMSLHGWVLGFAIVIGAFIGSKLLLKIAFQ